MNSGTKMTPGCFEREQLMSYATRLLDPAEASKVEAHLAGGCEACRAVVNEYRTLDSVLDEWKPAEPSPWFDARLRAAIDSGHSTKRGVFGFEWRALTAWPKWPKWIAPALAAALVVAVSLVAVRVHRTHVGSALAGKTQASMSRPGGTAVGAAPPPSTVQPGSEEAGTPETARQAAEDDEMLANFDILSELPAPPPGSQVEN